MIIKGGSRRSAGFFAKHLMKTEENERVAIVEMNGLAGETLPEAFREMRLLAASSRAENYFYHASINPREDERLSPEQWDIAVDTLEKNLGLEGHARFQVEHEKEGRTHRHIVWSRIDLDTLTATSDSFTYQAHDKTRLELEQLFDHEPTPPTPQPSQRKSREFADWENFRAAESSIDPKEMKAEITALWQQSDGGRAFQAAIEEKGYLLAKGDRRDFVLIDPEGDVHSLARRIDGAKAADIRAKMTDLDRDILMTAQQASAWMKGKEEAENSGSNDARILPEEQQREREQPNEVAGGIVHTLPPDPSHNPKLAILEKYALEHPAEPLEYVRVNSAKEFSDFYKALYTSTDWQDLQPSPASRRVAWDAEQARIAEIERLEAQTQKPAQPEHDHVEGELPVEPVSFERATRGIDPPLSMTEREQSKRQDESWLEFVTRQQPERDKAEAKDKSDAKEPELER